MGNTRLFFSTTTQYLATPKFSPIFHSLDAHGYFSQLYMLSDGILGKEEAMMGFIPDFSVLPSIYRAIDPIILKKIIKAIKDQKAVNIQYQSMSRPSPIYRWITPHAFAFDGFRWHVRAHCELNNDFRDFILGRIINVKNIKKRKVEPSDDFKWNQFVTIKLAAHPDLSPDQKKIIEKEYGMTNGIAEITMRAAFVYYALLRFRLENPNDSRFSKNKNAILLNYEEIEEFI